MSSSKGRKNRLPLDWMLDFGTSGSRSIKCLQVRKVDDLDEILPSLQTLFLLGE